MARRRVNPLERKRVARACETCRRRKEKCDGKLPCRHCKTRNKAESCCYDARFAKEREAGLRTSPADPPTSVLSLSSPDLLDESMLQKPTPMLKDSKGKLCESQTIFQI